MEHDAGAVDAGGIGSDVAKGVASEYGPVAVRRSRDRGGEKRRRRRWARRRRAAGSGHCTKILAAFYSAAAFLFHNDVAWERRVGW